MQFFRFSSGGSPIDALVGVLFGTAPGAIAILLFGRKLWWVVIAMLVLYSCSISFRCRGQVNASVR
jgi:hypothetical protein